MGRGRLALAGCMVATMLVVGCGTQTSKSTSDALGWDCGDFRTASFTQNSAAIRTLAEAVAKATGNPVGEGKKVQAAIDRLCAGAPSDKVVGEAAVEAVVAGAEDPPAQTTTPAETTTVPAETTTAPAETTTAPAETTTEETTHTTTTPAGHE